MEQIELQELLKTPTKLVDKIKTLAPTIPDDAINFEPEQHKIVLDKTYRPDRKVETPTGKDASTGEVTYTTNYIPVHRIPSATQKLIIDWSVFFALGNGVNIDATPREKVATDQVMIDMLQRTLDDNKFSFLAQEIERIKQRFLTVLLVWYSVPAEEGFWSDIASSASKFKMRCTILSPKDGDTIVPIRDQYKDMIGAARYYVVKVDDKEVNKMDLFLQDKYMTFKQDSAGWVEEKSTAIPYGKANFILDEQERTEWADVAAKIERLEEIDSDNSDENQQSAFPILVATGDILAATGGGASNTRKTFEMSGEGADLKYVESKGGQESASNERKNVRADVFIETATPDFKFEDISGDLPGVTVEMMLLPTTNKAKGKQQGSIGMFHQRNFNFLKAAMAVINVSVKPSVSLPIKPLFSIPLPRNLTEESNRAIALVGAGLMSTRTAVTSLGFTKDIDAEIEAIEKEVAARALLVKPVTPPPVTI